MNSIRNAVPYKTAGGNRLPGREAGRGIDRPVLATRRVGKTVLTITAVEASTLAGGRAHAARGADIRYLVRAMGNASREAVSLGTFATLWQAEQYLAVYSPRGGLMRKAA